MRLILPLLALAVSGCAVKVQHTGLESPMASAGYSDGFAEGAGNGTFWNQAELEQQVDQQMYDYQNPMLFDPMGIIEPWQWELNIEEIERLQQPTPMPIP